MDTGCTALLQCLGQLSLLTSMARWVSTFGLSGNNKWWCLVQTVEPCGLHSIMHPWFWHYIYCLLVYLAFPLASFVLYLFFPYLSFPLRIGWHRFQTIGCKRLANLRLSCFSLFWVIVFLCSWCMAILCCSKFSYSRYPRFILYFCGCSPGFDFVFSVLVKGLAGNSISEIGNQPLKYNINLSRACTQMDGIEQDTKRLVLPDLQRWRRKLKVRHWDVMLMLCTLYLSLKPRLHDTTGCTTGLTTGCIV